MLVLLVQGISRLRRTFCEGVDTISLLFFPLAIVQRLFAEAELIEYNLQGIRQMLDCHACQEVAPPWRLGTLRSRRATPRLRKRKTCEFGSLSKFEWNMHVTSALFMQLRHAVATQDISDASLQGVPISVPTLVPCIKGLCNH